MSYLIATPEIVSTAATDLAGIASNLGAANSAATASTTEVLPAALDEVSAEIAALFDAHGQAFQAASAQAAAFHEQFVQLINAGMTAYTTAENNVVQTLTGAAATSAQGLTPLSGAANPAFSIGLPSLHLPSLNLTVHLPNISVNLPNLPSLNLTLPTLNLNLPGLSLNLPSLNLPGVNLPNLNLPSLNLPNLNLSLTLPNVNLTLPNLNLPNLNLPNLNVPGINPQLLQPIEQAQIAYNTGLINGELGFNQGLVNGELALERFIFGGNDSALNGFINRSFNTFNMLLVNTPEQFINGITGAGALPVPPGSLNSSLLITGLGGTPVGVFNSGIVGGPVNAIDQSVVAALDLIGLPFQGTPLAFDPNTLLAQVDTAQQNYNTGLINGEVNFNTSLVGSEVALEQRIFGTDSALNGVVNRGYNVGNLLLVNTPEELLNSLSGALPPSNFNSSILTGGGTGTFNGGQIGGPVGAFDQSLSLGLNVLGLIGEFFGIPATPI
jgi:hypothetical protein